MFQKRGIALLITLLFIISITFSVGVGLKQINKANSSTKKESFLIQTSIILDDVMYLLQNTKELDNIVKNSSIEGLNIFLAQSAFIPFESSGIKMVIELHSARSKFNLNTLVDKNGTIYVKREEALKIYLGEKKVNEAFVDMLEDLSSGFKEDMTYQSDIFNEKPNLFRDYIASLEHFNIVKKFYLQRYKEDDINQINFEDFLYFSKERARYKIDLNYATQDVWKMLLGCDILRAKELVNGSGTYTKLDNLYLSDDEKLQLANFNVSYFEPYIDVKVEIIQNNMSAKIRFEYDMKTKKGSNFSYEI